MIRIRKFFTSPYGFTLVELMVVVVVLGILAGIAVQRMGDVRNRTEQAAERANIRLLLGAANLARSRNYGSYMYNFTGFPPGHANYPSQHDGDYNSTIRWQRPCDKPPVTQFLGSLLYYPCNNYLSGYYTFSGDVEFPGNPDPNFVNQRWYGGDGEGIGYSWRPGQEYNLTDYFESFPKGYAVEIVYAARDADGGSILFPGNFAGQHAIPYVRGYHQDRMSSSNNPYDEDAIYIYKFVGEVHDPNDSYWINFNSLLPGGPTTGLNYGIISCVSNRDGTDGSNYPYHNRFNHATDYDVSDDWILIYPES